MNMNDYQTAARRTAMGNSLDHFVMGLAEEAGEVAAVMKRHHRGDADYGIGLPGLRVLTATAQDKLIDEIGDVLWYVAMIADELQIDLELVAQRNVTKLQSRMKRNVITGSGDNR